MLNLKLTFTKGSVLSLYGALFTHVQGAVRAKEKIIELGQKRKHKT